MAAEQVTSEAKAERSKPGTGKVWKNGAKYDGRENLALRQDAGAMRLGLLPILSGHFLNPTYGDTGMEYQLL